MHSRGSVRDQHAHGEKLKSRGQNFRAVAFHVEVIAPAADGLRQQNAGDQRIRQCEKIQLFPPGIEERRQQAAQDPAVDGDAAFPDIQYGNGIRPELIQTHENVVKPRAHDPEGNDPKRQVDNGVLRQLAAAFLLFCQQNGAENARHDQHAVPADAQKKSAAVGNRQAFRPFPKFYSL